MINNTWLLIDVSCLAHRSFHVLQDLSYEGIRTGAIYGFFNSVFSIRDKFQTEKIAFCFDAKSYIRKGMNSSYKKKNGSQNGLIQRQARQMLHQQIDMLREEHLPRCGFKNIFLADGFEADDLIASLVTTKSPKDKYVIVSSDKDLYQLLLGNEVTIWQPHKKAEITSADIKKETGFSATRWNEVKALAGCDSDNIPGVPGVGEKTAIKYLLGTLKKKSQAYENIQREKNFIAENLKLTTLPLPGTPTFELVDDEFSDKGWREVSKELGFKGEFI